MYEQCRSVEALSGRTKLQKKSNPRDRLWIHEGMLIIILNNLLPLLLSFIVVKVAPHCVPLLRPTLNAFMAHAPLLPGAPRAGPAPNPPQSPRGPSASRVSSNSPGHWPPEARSLPFPRKGPGQGSSAHACEETILFMHYTGRTQHMRVATV